MLKPFKYVVQAYALEVDEDGKILGERQSDPFACYGKEHLLEQVEKYEKALEQLKETA